MALKQPSILFCFYPLSVRYNHGIALLSRLCKDRGIHVGLCVLECSDSFKDAVTSINWDYIGFSTVTKHDFKKCFPFIDAAKRLGKKVILGGTYAPDIDPFIPIPVCRGDGENLPDFILHGDAELFMERQVCSNINSLPLPDYDLFSAYPFKRGIGVIEDGKAMLPYFSSRGCPYRCSFCLVSVHPQPLRIRTRVKDDLEWLVKRYHPDMLFLGDCLAPYYSTAWKASWEDFKHPFFAYIRADIEADNLEWMIDHGMMACAFGIESGDEKYRNEVLKKGLTDEQIYRTVDALKRHGITYVPYYMIGTIGETYDQKAKTFAMKERIGGHPIIWEYEHLERNKR